MLDNLVRRALTPLLSRAAAGLDRSWVTPNRLTAAGLVLGVGSAAAAATGHWGPSLALWLASRLADGLDGPLARRRAGSHNAAVGGFVDICADFVVYGATVVGVAIGATAGRGAAWWPFLLLLFAYYVNGTVFLAFSSIAERSGRTLDDGRSLSFLPSLAEGTETIVVHSAWLLFPQWAAPIAVGWALTVAISALQRMLLGYRLLS